MDEKRIAEPVLVTGGAGFIGGHLVHQLARAGLEVRLLDIRPPVNKLQSNVKVTVASILDEDVLASLMSGVGTLFHCAAQAALWVRDKDLYERINVEGTSRVLHAAASAKVGRIVCTSTETILKGWNDSSAGVISEDLPTVTLDNMAGPYTRSKWKAAELVRKAVDSGLPVVSVYPTIPVGPGDRSLTAPTVMIRDFVSGATPAYLETCFNYVNVEDVARGHILAAANGHVGEGYILGGVNLGFTEFLDLLNTVTGQPMPEKKIPYALARAFAGLSEFGSRISGQPPKASVEGVRLAKYDSIVTIAKARSQLGYAPGNLQAALAKSVSWLQDEGLLEMHFLGKQGE